MEHAHVNVFFFIGVSVEVMDFPKLHRYKSMVHVFYTLLVYNIRRPQMSVGLVSPHQLVRYEFYHREIGIIFTK